MFSHFSASQSKSKFLPISAGGFGLIELLVSISIMAIVSAIILARQDKFNSAILLRSQAYEVALDIREVQLGAVSARADASGEYRTPYGAYFNTGSSFDSSYIIYRDANGNGHYSTGEIYGEQGVIDRRFEVREIRADGSSINDVSILFQRPNFDALFYDGPNSPVSASTIEIDIARRGESGSGNDVVRTVEVTSTGQIAVLE